MQGGCRDDSGSSSAPRRGHCSGTKTARADATISFIGTGCERVGLAVALFIYTLSGLSDPSIGALRASRSSSQRGASLGCRSCCLGDHELGVGELRESPALAHQLVEV